jgi:thiamine kinase-like enzyme
MPPEPILDSPSSSTLGSNLSEHPAVCAWKKLRPARVEPVSIDILKRNTKSSIYRLHGVGPSASPVIAKRCVTATALTERLIYREILPALPLPGVRYYGCIADGLAEFHWLFIEDAGDSLYSPVLPAHRRVVARWLARLHTCTACFPAAAALPDRGPGFYLEQLRQARKNILDNWSNPALQAHDLAVLEEIKAQFDFLELRWDQVQHRCEDAPQTLVHGDLKPKNIRIQDTPNGIALLAFDWELAGWGVPATDLLRCPDLDLYRSEASTTWPALDYKQLRKLVEVGRLFRAIIAICWKSLALSFPCPEWPVEKLRLYRDALAETIELLGIK